MRAPMSRAAAALTASLLLTAACAGARAGDPTAACTHGADLTEIGAVQGDGPASPLVGRRVTIAGVVVGDFQSGDGDEWGTDLGGFFVQSVEGDGDPATSDGIYVYGAPVDVAEGDVVRVTGRVREFRGLTQVSDRPTVLVCATGRALPAPTPVVLPVGSSAELEALEGMLVTFPQDLYVVDHHDFDRYGELVLSAPVAGGRPFQPTAVLSPDDPGLAERIDLTVRSRIVLDDGRGGQNPDPARHPNGEPFDLENRFRAGDRLRDVTGVLDYAFDSYRVQPTRGAVHTALNPRPPLPEVGGSVRAAAFNVYNYFDGFGNGCGPAGAAECRGADDAEEFRRQRAKVSAALVGTGAHVAALMEVENDADGGALRDLVAALDEATAPGTFAYVDGTGPVGTDAIRVALVYRPTHLTPVGAPAVLDSPGFVDPNGTGTDRNRAALAQTFEDARGGRFTVVALHLKSKGSACGARDDDPLQGDCAGTRLRGVLALLEWLATDPTGSGDPDVLLLGDLNAYGREDAVTALSAAGFTDLLREHGGEGEYTYVFDGLLGYLDHALASPSLAPQVTGAAAWHVNADEPDLLDYDTTFKAPAQRALYAPDAYRSSDHDPVVVGLELDAAPPP